MDSPIGFIGVGKMGGPMATRLLQAGYRLAVYDVSPTVVESLVALGATAADSAAEVASTAQTVLTSLPTPAILRQVTLGPGGIADGARVRTVIDLGTTGPVVTREVARGLAEKGITLVDSPVTGGVGGAIKGTLAVIVAGPQAAVDAIEPIVATFGRVFRVGEAPGQAQVAKLANNMLSAAALAVSCEAMAMGVKAGLDPTTLVAIINAGSGRNSATEDKFPKAILPRTFDFGMKTGLFLKDIRLCIAEAESLGVPMIVGDAVRQMFAVTQARYGEGSDFTEIAKVLEEWAGLAGSQ